MECNGLLNQFHLPRFFFRSSLGSIRSLAMVSIRKLKHMEKKRDFWFFCIIIIIAVACAVLPSMEFGIYCYLCCCRGFFQFRVNQLQLGMLFSVANLLFIQAHSRSVEKDECFENRKKNTRSNKQKARKTVFHLMHSDGMFRAMQQ